MTTRYTVRIARTKSGYTGQLVEWPEVISEGRTLKDCQSSIRAALEVMIQSYRQRGRQIPSGRNSDADAP